MKNTVKNLIIILFSTNLLVSCGSVKGKSNRQIEFKQDVTIYNDQGESLDIKKDSKINLDNKNMLIESPGYVSLLVVPLNEDPKEVSVNLKNLESKKIKEMLGATIDHELSKVLFRINNAQQLLMQEKGNEALMLINEIQKEYVNLDFLDILKASAYVMIGDPNNAKILLEKSIEKYPDNEETKQLYNSLFMKR